MLIAQVSDTHILAPGKLYRARVQASSPTAEAVYAEFDTAACLARAVAALNAQLGYSRSLDGMRACELGRSPSGRFIRWEGVT